jgi:hypothetical protein
MITSAQGEINRNKLQEIIEKKRKETIHPIIRNTVITMK